MCVCLGGVVVGGRARLLRRYHDVKARLEFNGDMQRELLGEPLSFEREDEVPDEEECEGEDCTAEVQLVMGFILVGLAVVGAALFLYVCVGG